MQLHVATTEKAEQAAMDASEALGQRTAEEVAKLVGDHREIAVFSPDIAPGQAPSFGAQMDIFTKTLKKRGIKIGATKLMPGGLSPLVLGARPPASAYVALLEQAPNAGAIVSFVGPPNVSLEEMQKL